MAAPCAALPRQQLDGQAVEHSNDHQRGGGVRLRGGQGQEWEGELERRARWAQSKARSPPAAQSQPLSANSDLNTLTQPFIGKTKSKSQHRRTISVVSRPALRSTAENCTPCFSISS